MSKPKNRKSFKVPVFIRRLTSFLEFIHWRLALYYVLKLFLTPIRFPIPKREIAVRKEAVKHTIPLHKKEAQLFEWGVGDKRVIMMHGWSGRASQFFRLTEKLVDEGYHVFSVEGPAHGDSPFHKTDMLEFIQALEWTIRHHGPFDTAIGHSLGGMALFNVHGRGSGVFKHIITIGTPANVRAVINQFCEAVNASSKVAAGLVHNIEKNYGLTVDEVSTDTLAAIWNPGGLIFNDKQDKDVSISFAYELAKVWSKAELVVSDGLGHRRILSDPKVHRRILQLLNS